jgi:peptide/nickel transport system ATP-binding protein
VNTLLSVADLQVTFRTEQELAHAVHGVSFDLAPGETLCIVGESGCGKSVTALAIMGLVACPPGAVTGQITFEGQQLVGRDAAALADLRGDRLAMIFQEPMTALNPAFTIGDQLSEVLIRHRGLSKPDARATVIEMLRHVRIPAAESRIDSYPHQLSGGMRQRAMIAMALLCAPALLIADEPTTALDVTIQAQVLDLMRGLRAEMKTAIMLITHDLGVVAEMGDRVIVMYAGEIVEEASVEALFAMPEHPYTVGLLGAVPTLGTSKARLTAIDGIVPSATATTPGCAFAPRCPFADEHCRREAPPLRRVRGGHASRCWKAPLAALAA